MPEWKISNEIDSTLTCLFVRSTTLEALFLTSLAKKIFRKFKKQLSKSDENDIYLDIVHETVRKMKSALDIVW